MTRTHLFEAEFTVPVPRDEAFAFFSDAHNLEKITPPELRFRVLTTTPIVLSEGALIDYRLSLFFVPFHWRTRIAAWNPPFSFTDEQLRGPYASWVHTHTFEERGSSTILRDSVRYALPLFPAGEIAHFLIRRQIGRIFAFRKQAIRSLLG